VILNAAKNGVTTLSITKLRMKGLIAPISMSGIMLSDAFFIVSFMLSFVAQKKNTFSREIEKAAKARETS